MQNGQHTGLSLFLFRSQSFELFIWFVGCGFGVLGYWGMGFLGPVFGVGFRVIPCGGQ